MKANEGMAGRICYLVLAVGLRCSLAASLFSTTLLILLQELQPMKLRNNDDDDNNEL